MRKIKWTMAAIALALAGCGEIKQRSYWEHPKDIEAEAYLFQQCLNTSRPPGATHYNDQAEVVEACSSTAANMSRYCPQAATDCRPQYQRTRDDVRQVLPKEQDNED